MKKIHTHGQSHGKECVYCKEFRIDNFKFILGIMKWQLLHMCAKSTQLLAINRESDGKLITVIFWWLDPFIMTPQYV